MSKVINGYVMLLGIIGSGKTGLFNHFSDEEFFKISEPVEGNKRLGSFYAELEFITRLKQIDVQYHSTIAPMLEIYMAANLKSKIEGAVLKRGGREIVSDYGLPIVFARVLRDAGYMSALDFETFELTYSHLEVIPELIIYIDALDSALENIKKRGRDCEKGVTISYLDSLDSSYKKQINSLASKGSKLAIVKWNEGIDPLAIQTNLKLNRFRGNFDITGYRKEFSNQDNQDNQDNYEFNWEGENE